MSDKIMHCGATIQAIKEYVECGFYSINIEEQAEYQGGPVKATYVYAQGILDLIELEGKNR